VFASIDCLQRRPGLQFAIIARRRIDFIPDLLRHRHGLIFLPDEDEFSNYPVYGKVIARTQIALVVSGTIPLDLAAVAPLGFGD
jgi:hypothetical protein